MKYRFMIFIGLIFCPSYMTLKIKISDYGFEDDLEITGEADEVIEKFRSHMEEQHGIDYSKEAVIQMFTNRGHSLESMKQ